MKPNVREWIMSHEASTQFNLKSFVTPQETDLSSASSYLGISQGLDMLELVYETEQQFGVNFTPEALETFSTPEKLIIATENALSLKNEQP